MDDSSSVGLYKDSKGDTAWTSSEFGPVNICAFEDGAGYMIKQSTWTMESSAVYLIAEGESSSYSLSFSLNMQGTLGAGQYPSSVSVSLRNDDTILEWDSSEPGKKVNVSNGIAYEVVIIFTYSTDRALSVSTLGSLGFTWGMTFTLDSGSFVKSTDNQVTIKKVEESINGIYIDNGFLVSADGGYYVSSASGDKNFGTNGGMTTEINTDGTVEFKIQINISINGNDSSSLTLRISDSSGVRTIPIDCSKKVTMTKYLGSDNQLNDDLDSVTSFTGSVSITLDGVRSNSGTTIQVKLIPVNTTQTSG